MAKKDFARKRQRNPFRPTISEKPPPSTPPPRQIYYFMFRGSTAGYRISVEDHEGKSASAEAVNNLISLLNALSYILAGGEE